MDQSGEVIDNLFFESVRLINGVVKVRSRAAGRSGGIRDDRGGLMGIGGLFE